MRNSTILLFLLLFFIGGCQDHYTPKPPGYIRVNYPEKSYLRYDGAVPYSFEYPVYAVVEEDLKKNSEPYWYNIHFPAYNGTIHISYKPVKNNVNDFIEDSRILVYKHTSRSDGINELPFTDTLHNRYGMMYDLKGNVASSIQFFVTDSTSHFIRGSLYFNTSPNRDSLNPIIQFVRQDIQHLIESVEWK